MNPLDLNGPDFLTLFAILAFIALIVWFVLWSRMRAPDDEPGDEALKLDPFETAYLAGGPAHAVNAALAVLMQSQRISLEGDQTFRRTGQSYTGESVLEREIVHAIGTQSSPQARVLYPRLLLLTRPIHDRLTELGLLITKETEWKIRAISGLGMLLVVLLGAAKIQVGLSRHKPVFFLVVGVLVVGALWLISMLKGLKSQSWYRSRRGDRALKMLQDQHAALRATAVAAGTSLGAMDLALAVGLFGLVVFPEGPFQSLYKAIGPQAMGSCSSGSNCSSGGGCSGGGGCGGGGCGGCGGGGGD